MTRKQHSALVFLQKDHGGYTIESSEDCRALVNEFGFDDDTVIAVFKTQRFFIRADGGITPLPRPQGNDR